MSEKATEQHGPVAYMARNPVTANLIMLVLLIGGIISGLRIKKEVFPDFTIDVVTVSVAYAGASPEEVERGIVLAIEENVRGLDGVKKVTSKASEGNAYVEAELLEDADAQKVYQDIQQEVNAITTFPEDAEEPTIALASHKRGVLDLILYGDVSDRELREAGETLRDRFLLDPEITQVELSGVRDYEIQIYVSRDNLRRYNVTLDDLASTIDSLALELPGGSLKTESGDLLVRMKERRDYAYEFLDLPIITNNDGTVVRLRDIAEVRDGFDEDSDRFATWNGKPAVMIQIYRIGNQTPTGVAKAGLRLVEQFNRELPPGMRLVVQRDNSEIYQQRLELLRQNGMLGLSLVMITLGLFLEIRLAFWVMMGIPVSFLGALAFLPYFGASINMISMFAFLIALGIVVDDAIVVGENVYEHRQRGDSFLASAISGTREVMMPVVYSVLTNIVTFLPLMFLPGVIGKIWFFIPVVVILTFSVSLFECLFILPAHLGHDRQPEHRWWLSRWVHDGQQAFSRFFLRAVRTIYGPILEFWIKNRYIAFACSMVLLLFTIGFVQSRRIGIVPMMTAESQYATVTAVLPYGSPVARTCAIRDRLVAAAERVGAANGGEKLLRGVYAEIGGSYRSVSGGHVVSVRAYLTPEEKERPISTSAFTDKWRQETGQIVGLEAILFQADMGGPGSGASLSINLSHSDSETLDKACADFAEMLAEYPNVSDLDDGVTPGKAQLSFKMRPEGIALGLTASNVARQVRSAFHGAEAMRQQRGREEVKVKVRLPKAERISEYDLEELPVCTPAGTFVSLRDVATVERGRAYTSIERENGQRISEVTANVTPRSESENILADVLAKGMPKLKEKYPGLGYGYGGHQEDLREGLAALMLGFVVAVLGVYALLAIPFGSYTQPLIIMVCIPFGIVGAVLCHVMLGYPLSLMSMMGIVALSGVVVNDSLVLIDFANGERARGLSRHDAIVSAGIRRFRPIMLTTLTTFCGLAPMIFETSMQARFMVPMAISLGFGILFSTVITLLLVPGLYLIIEDVQYFLHRIFGFTPKK